jgi:aspartyl protease family protein
VARARCASVPRAFAGLVAALLLPLAGLAQTAAVPVQLNGLMGGKAALLLIDGEPRTLQLGASAKGVKLVSIEDQTAVVEVEGRRQTLAMGVPGSVGGDSGPALTHTIVLSAGPGGHFTATGTINGRTTQFLVDTGATSVALSQVEADRLGLRYSGGKRVVTQTANGLAPAHMFQIASLRIGTVEVRNVDAIVVPSSMSYVLLGNSFLTRFQMKRENDLLTLEQRY